MCVHNEHPTPLALFQLLPELCDLHKLDSLVLHCLLSYASCLPQQQLQQLRHEPHMRTPNQNKQELQSTPNAEMIEID